MIVCDYCNKQIKNDNNLLVIPLPEGQHHFHNDVDRQNGDCAGMMQTTIDATTGARPAKVA